MYYVNIIAQHGVVFDKILSLENLYYNGIFVILAGFLGYSGGV